MIDIVKSEAFMAEWMGLYVDGVLIHQEDYISATDLLRLLNIEHHVLMIDENWGDGLEGFPEKLEDVQLAIA